MLAFSFWESIARNNLNLSNNQITNLAFKTLELCSKNFEVIDLIQLPPELPKPEEEYCLLDNNFAFLDYAFHAYFIFRVRLCRTDSREFVSQYDDVFKQVFIHYATTQHALSLETVQDFYQNRTNIYNDVFSPNDDDSYAKLSDLLTMCIESDLLNDPMINHVPIISIFSSYSIQFKLVSSLKSTCLQLSNYHEQDKNIAANKKENKHEQKARQKKSASIKEKFSSNLALLGVNVYNILRLFIAVLPFVMIGAHFLVNLVLIAINLLVPGASVVFWVWGLICAINGVQDIFAIIYYIVFVVVWIPFYVATIASILKRNK